MKFSEYIQTILENSDFVTDTIELILIDENDTKIKFYISLPEPISQTEIENTLKTFVKSLAGGISKRFVGTKLSNLFKGSKLLTSEPTSGKTIYKLHTSAKIKTAEE